MSLIDKLEILKDRADLLGRVRSFFAERNVLEVDCPLIARHASVDLHIDLIEVFACRERRFLITSPEYPMKRLLAMGMGDIYQLSHVFRDGELGKKHSPEFMMIEWYRIGFSFEAMIDETLAVLQLFLGSHPIQRTSYRDILLQYAHLDYLQATPHDLQTTLLKAGLDPASDDKDTLLDQVMSMIVEPALPKTSWQVIYHYPASQAALSTIIEKKDQERVGERFEIYFNGVELANGYHELADSAEQKARFENANLQREQAGKSSLPMDPHLLEALRLGLPACCGVAVGFDRLMMLRHNTNLLSDIIPFGWHDA